MKQRLTFRHKKGLQLFPAGNHGLSFQHYKFKNLNEQMNGSRNPESQEINNFNEVGMKSRHTSNIITHRDFFVEEIGTSITVVICIGSTISAL